MGRKSLANEITENLTIFWQNRQEQNQGLCVSIFDETKANMPVPSEYLFRASQ
jgi:hypothetical protein